MEQTQLLPQLGFFTGGNTYSAQMEQMRYAVEKADDTLKLSTWPAPWCIEKTNPAFVRTHTYACTEQGRTELAEALPAFLKAFEAEVASGEIEIESPLD